MSLEALFETEDTSSVEEIKSKIRQRRAQMLVHSCIYYELNDNIISDHKWQEWAFELAELQNNNPECCKIDFYDDAFKDWNGSTGAFLPIKELWIVRKAQWLILYDRTRT